MRDFHQPNRSLVYAANGMAATSHPLASRVAVDILAQGGNAVDAAIAAAVLLGGCEPQMTGLGGDLFALIKPAGSEVILGLNGSGRAPAAFDAEVLRAAGHGTIPPQSAHAVTVPGAVDALVRMSERHGALGLDAVLAPSIRYFEEGIPVAPRVAFDWAGHADTLQGEARSHFLRQGRALPPGALFRLPLQAAVLREIAAKGRAGFYEGWVAEDMVDTLRALGGAHTLADFADQRSDDVTPIRGPYRGHEVVELPPNGQGATALLMLAMLERFDLSALAPFGAPRAHLEAEAAKLAYAERNARIADPGSKTDWQAMLAPEMAADLAARIDLDRAAAMPPPPAGAPHKETVYLTVVDRDRMAVSLIYSIFHDFGSGLMAPKSGILLHNRGAGFTLEAGHPNAAGPGKRPMHTIIPAMLVKDGRLLMPFGVMGAQYQSAGHARLITNMVDFAMDPQAAIDAPRSFPEAGQLKLERGYAPEVAAALTALGHDPIAPETPIGGAQAILIDEAEGVLIGASDPRKDGCALGY